MIMYWLRRFSPKFLAAFVAVMLLCVGAGVAQTVSTAQLSGSVHDPSGAVVPGASVAVSDASKGFNRSTTSDGQGNYQFLLLPPGTYTVKLSVDGKDFTQPLKVIKDPHSNGTEGDIQLQTKLMTSLTTQIDGVVDSINQIELLLAQLADFKSVLPDTPAAAPLREPAEQLRGKLFDIEQKLLRTKVTGRGQDGVRWSPQIMEKLGYLANEVDSSDFQPTTQQVAVHDELKEQAGTYQQRLKNVLEQEVVSFNAMLRQRNVPNLVTEMK